MKTFTCSGCNRTLSLRETSSCGTGYARMPGTPDLFCYDCCALSDLACMKSSGEIVLYLTDKKHGRNGLGYCVTNWPATLVFETYYYKKSFHNIGNQRIDVWFNFDGYVWHGYQIGMHNQICRCRKTKTKTKTLVNESDILKPYAYKVHDKHP